MPKRNGIISRPGLTDGTDSPDDDKSFWLEADLRTAEVVGMTAKSFLAKADVRITGLVW